MRCTCFLILETVVGVTVFLVAVRPLERFEFWWGLPSLHDVASPRSEFWSELRSLHDVASIDSHRRSSSVIISSSSRNRTRPDLFIFAGPHKCASISTQDFLLGKVGRDFLRQHGYLVPIASGVFPKNHCGVFNALAECVAAKPKLCPIGPRHGTVLQESLRQQFSRFQASQVGRQNTAMILVAETFDALLPEEMA